ncbi:MAG: hypothetical protein V2J55_09500 [Candidatus Competibacteraceae bacterium]|jgi:hypothetical protein|nr:hypothetical protein [Candidatus Competibacteraceae bacterium]
MTLNNVLCGFAVLILASVSQLGATESGCLTVSGVAGEYHCAGECVVRTSDGGTELIPVTGEVDVIQKIEGAKTELYRSEISGSNDFHEVEIGALTGKTLRTATAKVSDNQFPVLEEYVFEHDASCAATAYTKIVRNPSQQDFKACNIHCEKQD